MMIKKLINITNKKTKYKIPGRTLFCKTFLLICILAFVITGCGASSGENDEDQEAEQSKYLNVGFSQLGAESDWRVANTESIKESLSRTNGIELLFDDAQQKQDKQILAIRNFIQQEVDFIVLAPVTETGWDTVLQEAKDAEIPVIIVDRMVSVNDTYLYTAWVGSDFNKEAEIACEWLNKFTAAKGILASDLRIVDIQGTLGATAQIGRSNGLLYASKKYGWNIVASIPADYTQAKAKEVMQSLLKDHDDINVVYCENDNEAIGAIEAIEESGRKVGTDIKNGEILIISFDAAHSGLSKVLEGKIALDVECNPLQGESVLKLINEVKEGNDFQKYTYIEESAFTADDTVTNVDVDGEKYDITILTQEILDGREY